MFKRNNYFRTNKFRWNKTSWKEVKINEEMTLDNVLKWNVYSKKMIDSFLKSWIFSVNRRKDNNVKDLTCLLSELFYDNSFITINWYNTLFNKKKERISENRMYWQINWKVIWLQAKQLWNTFSVTIADNSIRKVNWKKETAWIRTYSLTDIWWKVNRDISIDTSNEELKSLLWKDWLVNENIKYTIDQRRWVSFLWEKYQIAKILLHQLKIEKTLLKQVIDVLEKNNKNFNKWKYLSKWFWLMWPIKEKYKKNTKSSLERKEKVYFMENKILWIEENYSSKWIRKELELSKLDNKRVNEKVFAKIVRRYWEVKDYIMLLNFNVRATEVSFFNNIWKLKRNNNRITLEDLTFELQSTKKTKSIDTNWTWKFIIETNNWIINEVSIRYRTESIKI